MVYSSKAFMKYRWMLLVASLQAADPWDDLRAKHPVGTTMELRLAGPTVFRQRELIRIGSTRPASMSPSGSSLDS